MNDYDIVILGAGTAGLITALHIREKYPYSSICIIKSKDIGIVGVGEGSTEHWDEFMRFVGIDHFELITETNATIKIGILFKDWNPGQSYVHSVGQHYVSGSNRLETFNQLYLHNEGRFPLSPEFEKIYFKNNVTITPALRPSNQYHFDTYKLNNYLTRICENRKIKILDGIVEDVELAENGDVSHLELDSGVTVKANLFVDCSGFKKVIASKVGCEWVSYSKYLPMNHALAFPTEFNNPREIEPYTTATALSSGWVWRIPTQTRYGNGYVFCDAYTTPEAALLEVSKHLGKNIEKAARDIKFEAGRLSSFWKNNVVSIGLASSFAEPLEAQSIGFTIIQARAFIEYIDVWQCNRKISEQYNTQMIAAFDNIIDYLQLHYLTKRNDSAFWKERPYQITDMNKHVLEIASEGHVDPLLFEGRYLMFRAPNWYQILAGLNLIDKTFVKSLLGKNRELYNKTFADKTINHLNEIKNNFSVISHRDYLDLVIFNYHYRNENRVSFPSLG